LLATEHFTIYFHQGEDRTARRLAVIAEETWQALKRQSFGPPPPTTHVVLVDQWDLANGYATPLPRNTIVVSASWPPSSDFIGGTDDWLRLVFTHEFTHIVHLDRSFGGARAVRNLFGRISIAFPNLYLPAWQIEGLATYEESVLTGGGRLHAGDFGAIVNEALIFNQPGGPFRAAGKVSRLNRPLPIRHRMRGIGYVFIETLIPDPRSLIPERQLLARAK